MIKSPPLEPIRTFLFSYNHDGASWTLEIKAKDEDDARARVDRLQWARFDGELMAEVPVQLAPVGRLFVFVRNLLSSPG